MEPLLFESKPPFVIKVYDTYFQITWESNIETPEDKYPYEKVRSVAAIIGKKEPSLTNFIYSTFFQNKYARRIENYDELLIEFESGEKETRYVNGQLTDSMNEALDMIQEKLNSRKHKKQ